jgi:Flp pilus assembly protein TadD
MPQPAPTQSYLRFIYGTALDSLGKVAEAVAQFNEALALNPRLPEAHCGLGLALYRKHDLDGAIAEYHEALRLNPNLPGARRNVELAIQAKLRKEKGSRNVHQGVRPQSK